MAVIIGILIGTVLGLTGAGGSVFAVPLLILSLDITPQTAIGLSLGAVATSALYGVITRLRSKTIDWLPAMIFIPVGSLTAPAGIWLNQRTDPTLLLIGFSTLVLLVAARLWLLASDDPEDAQLVRAEIELHEETEGSKGVAKKWKSGQPKELVINVSNLAGLSIGGAITGFLSGLFGVGGGFIIIPTLLFLTKTSMIRAIATSLLIIAAVSSVAFSSFMFQTGSVDIRLIGPLGIGGIMGMTIGLITSRYIAGPILQKIFAAMMILMALITVITQLDNGINPY